MLKLDGKIRASSSLIVKLSLTGCYLGVRKTLHLDLRFKMPQNAALTHVNIRFRRVISEFNIILNYLNH